MPGGFSRERLHGEVDLTVVLGFDLGGRPVVQGLVQAGVVVPVDPGDGGELEVVQAAPRPFVPDELGLVGADEALRERVVVGVADRADRGSGAGVERRSVQRIEVYCLGSTDRCNTCLVQQP